MNPPARSDTTLKRRKLECVKLTLVSTQGLCHFVLQTKLTAYRHTVPRHIIPINSAGKKREGEEKSSFSYRYAILLVNWIE